MAVTQLFTCICGVQKKTSNHWILATCTHNSVRFIPWDWNLARSEDVIVLCGEGCAAALLSRCLGEWKQVAADDAQRAADEARRAVLKARTASRELTTPIEPVVVKQETTVREETEEHELAVA